MALVDMFVFWCWWRLLFKRKEDKRLRRWGFHDLPPFRFVEETTILATITFKSLKLKSIERAVRFVSGIQFNYLTNFTGQSFYTWSFKWLTVWLQKNVAVLTSRSNRWNLNMDCKQNLSEGLGFDSCLIHNFFF